MKKLITIFTLIFIAFISQGEAHAFEQASGSSARLSSSVVIKEQDNRAEILRGFLEQYNSPMAGEAENFVKYADQYDLDWRLVASIAGLESGFGKHIPYNSYNAWGWGVYGDNVIRFESWEEGIETLSHGLRTRYLKDNPQSDPYVIGPTYAASPTWAVRVSYFMNRMEEYRLRNAKSTLTLAL
jgi:hypothetical protein